jgi:hypothetical protein
MSNLSTKKSPNLKSAAAPKKTSAASNLAHRRKTASIAIAAEAPPQVPKLEASRVAAPDRKAQPKTVQTSTEATEAREPRLQRATKPERALMLLSQPEAEKPKASDEPVAMAVKRPKTTEAQHEERATKQDRMLTLLNRPAGASIAEMMQATNWQQHSVRGFLAGTVRKKLGFSVTSAMASDGVRRYRIE